LLAVGLDRFTPVLGSDLSMVADGGSAFRGSPLLRCRSPRRRLRCKLETVYRRITESLRTASFPPSAFRPVLDSWLFTLESDVVATDPGIAERGSCREPPATPAQPISP